MGQFKDNRQVVTLQAATTAAVTATGTALSIGGGVRALTLILEISAAERDSADETYDFYVTTSNGGATAAWDICHFSQIATTGAKRFVARILCSGILPQTVTTAAPGVPVIDSATLAVVSGGTNAVKSLGVGLVRHGPIGSSLNHELVIAGTIVTGISYSLTAIVERY